jgi:hypothetical protein
VVPLGLAVPGAWVAVAAYQAHALDARLGYGVAAAWIAAMVGRLGVCGIEPRSIRRWCA